MDHTAEALSSTAMEARRRVELSQLPVAKVTVGAASRLPRSCTSTTGVLTVLSQIQKENLRKFYQGKKYKSLDPRRPTP